MVNGPIVMQFDYHWTMETLKEKINTLDFIKMSVVNYS